MPQIAPLSWVFLSFGLFLVIFVVFSAIWWSKKSVLSLNSGSGGVSGLNVWGW